MVFTQTPCVVEVIKVELLHLMRSTYVELLQLMMSTNGVQTPCVAQIVSVQVFLEETFTA